MRTRIAVSAALLVAILAGCGLRVADNTIVRISYRGTTADGEVFEESTEGEPLEFMVGVGRMLPALEAALDGLRAGDKKQISVKAADAYGERVEEGVQEIPRDQIPPDMSLEVGSSMSARTADGMLYLTVVEVKEDSVILDFNHPLAGKDLTFDITIESVRRPTAEDMRQYSPQ